MDKRACIYLIVFVFVLVSAYVIVSLRRNPEIRAEDAKAGAFVENGRKAYRIASEQLFLADFSGDKSLKDYNSDENGAYFELHCGGNPRRPLLSEQEVN